ncbi:MAG: glycosyltransferase family 2 protein [Candidatus Aureabacteria bacterium]|nr:glycosyltransferase family 2 protein [Candidatus Auribacterota bacterium]
MKPLSITIIIPVKDEEGNILSLCAEIEKSMETLKCSWNCLWIDDGSSDGSLDLLKHVRQKNPRHQFIVLEKNFGQSAAFMTGFHYAKGDLFVTLDADGQNNPHDIPVLVRHLLKTKADMVNGYRSKRRDSGVRKFSSKIGNFFRNWMTGDSIRDVGCSLRVFRRECVEGLFLFKGMHRFLPTLVRLNGFNHIEQIPVHHRARHTGRSKYGIRNRLWVGLLDTLAVRWMKWRKVNPRVKSTSL